MKALRYTVLSGGDSYRNGKYIDKRLQFQPRSNPPGVIKNDNFL